MSSSFLLDNHVKYYLSCLEGLPEAYVSLDTSRLTVVYFSVVCLDVMGQLEGGSVDKKRVCDYIYGMQIGADESGKNTLCLDCSRGPQSSAGVQMRAVGGGARTGAGAGEGTRAGEGVGVGGFLGSSYAGQPFRTYTAPQHAAAAAATATSDIDTHASARTDATAAAKATSLPNAGSALDGRHCCSCECVPFEYAQSHLAMAYTALATLITLGDDLCRLDRGAVLHAVRTAQQADGAFRATRTGTEADTRFLYCACAISSMLGDWSAVDCDKAVQYIQRCVTYEGGISLLPGAEAHGGATYTAVASLVLMGRLQDLGPAAIAALISWCQRRILPSGGYNGRTNKDPDSCYSFWIGATLELCGAFRRTDLHPNLGFILNECQYAVFKNRPAAGGFSKCPGDYPDVLHTFYSIMWLSLEGSTPRLRAIHPTWAVCSDRAEVYERGRAPSSSPAAAAAAAAAGTAPATTATAATAVKADD